jgi:predicted nucleotidyltransferase
MRLTADQVEIIRSLLHRQFGAGSGIWLFGSRTDDSTRGGDIDLYVAPERLPGSNLFLLRRKLQRELEKRLHNAVDLVIDTGRTTAFMRLAKREGIAL